MSEYLIVSFLKKPPQRFERTAWPLHVTLLGTFQTELTTIELAQQMTNACLNTHTFVLTGKSIEMFGYNNDIQVTGLHKTSTLLKLHTKLLSSFLKNAALKATSFSGDGYRPHVTDQHTGNIELKQEITVHSVSLVKLEGNYGLVVETVELN